MPVPIRMSAAAVDLSARIFTSTAITGSPSSATETVVCTVTTSGDIAALAGCVIMFGVAYTVAGSGVSARYRIKQTGTGGSTIFDSGVTTAGITAGNLVSENVQGFDPSPVLPGQVYVLTMVIGSGSGASTVSAANGIVIVV